MEPYQLQQEVEDLRQQVAELTEFVQSAIEILEHLVAAFSTPAGGAADMYQPLPPVEDGGRARPAALLLRAQRMAWQRGSTCSPLPSTWCREGKTN